jgi:heat shock protein HslJ
LKGKSYETKHENGTTITLKFDKDESKVFGKIVNNYFGPYEIKGKEISFGPLASTMMMGLPVAMEAERDYMSFLNDGKKTYELKGKTLTISNETGTSYTFEEVETQE